MNLRQAEIQQMIDDCLARESQLSQWEAEFIDSISNYFADNGDLTEKQYSKLEDIWEKVTAHG